MKKTKNTLFQNYQFFNWRVLILIATVCIYLFLFDSWVIKDNFFVTYGRDYFAYWSAGTIADQKGYSEIYNLDSLRSVQTLKLKSLGVSKETYDYSTRIFPVAYFSAFVIPFQILSRFDLVLGYWLWAILNLIVLVGYLVFFTRKILPNSDAKMPVLKMLILTLLSYSVFNNFMIGQIEVFLLVCTGEFLRNALRKKPVLSGLWLGGLLIKPQVLILIIPVIFLLRNWKVFLGFAESCGMILVTSLALSGFDGLKTLVNLWTRYPVSIATGAPEAMINWRMVGLNLNTLLNTSLGWIFTVLGSILTLLAVYFLIKNIPPIGSPAWAISMLGVFSATLAITWHAHQHMAMVMIPFLIFALLNKLIPEQLLFSWSIATPIISLVIAIGTGLITYFMNLNIDNNVQMAAAFSGFVLNLLILFSTIQINKNST
jgi:hypothetical protein